MAGYDHIRDDRVSIGLGPRAFGRLAPGRQPLLDGSNTYKLHLPGCIPASLYWAVTIYNPADGTMTQTRQPFPSRSQFDKVPSNSDSSMDIYLGPT